MNGLGLVGSIIQFSFIKLSLICDILADSEGPYLSYQSWQSGTVFMKYYVTIMYPIYDRDDGMDLIHNILSDKKGSYLFYYS